MPEDRKAVLLSGCSGGLGFQVAKRFVEGGYIVFGLDVKAPKTALDGLRFIQANITKMDDVEAAYQMVSETGARLDCIISTAGIYDLNSLVEMSEEDFIRIFDINVFASYRINKTFLPLLADKGKIFLISSELAPLDPLPFTGIYGISKSLVEKYAYSLRMELQLLGYQVVVIRPGAIDTGMLSVSTRKMEEFAANTSLYRYNAIKMKEIVESVESKKVPPAKIANIIYKASQKKKAKYVYSINRNKGLLLLNALPKRTQNWIIKQILKTKQKGN